MKRRPKLPDCFGAEEVAMPVKIVRVKAKPVEVSRYWSCPKCVKGRWLTKAVPATSKQSCLTCGGDMKPWTYKER